MIAVRGLAPTNCTTGFPPTNNAKVGMLITPYARVVRVACLPLFGHSP